MPWDKEMAKAKVKTGEDVCTLERRALAFAAHH